MAVSGDLSSISLIWDTSANPCGRPVSPRGIWNTGQSAIPVRVARNRYDVASGASYLRVIAEAHHLDLTRVIAIGHSAGGHLAIWLASKGNPKLAAAVALGGVVDLKRAWELKLSDSVVATFLGGAPDQQPGADPMRLLPLRTKQVLFHGVDDDIVPVEIARHYMERALSLGDDAKLIELPGGHFEPIDPRTAQWAAVKDEIARMVRSSSSSAV